MKLSQKAACKVLGCSNASIVRWEHGLSSIPRYVALACAAISHGLPPIGERPSDER